MARVWFVTGASRGVGRAIVEYALQRGDQVVATARDVEDLRRVSDHYGSQRIVNLTLDVTDYQQAVECAQQGVAAFGHVDIVVNNAGWSNVSSVEDISIADFRKHIDINFFGVVNVTKAFLPILRKQQSGHIVQVGSVGGRVGTPAQVAYQSAKWAVNGFSTGLAQELAPFGIRVTVLEPGAIKTDFATAFSGSSIPEHYRSTAGAMADAIARASSEATTRPEKLAKVIDEVYRSTEPPLRLLVGADAVAVGPMAMNNLRMSDEKWKPVSMGDAIL